MWSQPGRGIGAWILLAPHLASANGASDAAGLALRWNDPSELSPTTAHDFESRLSERVGHAAFDPAASDHALSVNWLGTPEQCRVELSLIKGDAVEGTRVIESPSGDCRSLVPALLTVAALLVESGQTEPAPVPAPAPPRTATTPPPAPRTSPQSGAAPTSRNAGSSFFVGLGGATSSGLAPRLELGPQASIVWAPISPLRLGAEGALFFEHQYGAAPGFSLGHERAALILCGMPLGGYLALGLCATAAVHRFSSQGISLPRAERQTLATATVGASARAEWRLAKNLWWTGSFGADLSTRRLDFYYTTAAGSTIDVFRQERVSPTLMLALTLELL